jgi:hypothetical protein
MHRFALASLLAAAALAGCASNAERLVELRSDLRNRMDALYDRYGGGALASQARTDAQRAEGGGEGAAAAARFLGEVDRSYFEGYCLAHGRGERPFNLSGKLEAFMKDTANREACRDAAKVEARLRALEERVPRD